MNYFIEFYQELDTLNLIVFWGIIIVILLLLIFAIIISNKNKKLKNMLENKQKNNQEENIYNEEIPIISKEKEIKKEVSIKLNEETNKEPEEEKKFIAEEHVIEYNKDSFSLPNIKKNLEKTPSKQDIPNGPYQKNVLKEISSRQTSPIGIVKEFDKQNKELIKAQELQQSLNNESKNDINDKETIIKIEEKPKKEATIKNINKEKTIIEKQNIEINNEKQTKEQYLKEVSEKLSKATENNTIKRTEYELKQEEEAIISYEELMQKKDHIKIIDEEEAIISIEELIAKKNKTEKMYNLTEEEENEKFLNELKNLRKDL